MALSYSFRRPVPGLYGDFDPNGPNDSESEFRTPGAPPYAFDQPMEPAPTPPPPPAPGPGPIESRGTYADETGQLRESGGTDIVVPARRGFDSEPSRPRFREGEYATRELYNTLDQPAPALEKRGGFSRFLGGLTGIIGPTKNTGIPTALTYTGESLDARRAYDEKLKRLDTMKGIESTVNTATDAEEELLYNRKAEQDKIQREKELGKTVDQNRLISAGYQPYDPSTVQPSEMAGTPVLALDGKQYYLPVKMEIVGTPSTGISSVNTRTQQVTEITKPPTREPESYSVSPGGKRFRYNPATGKDEEVASVPPLPSEPREGSDDTFKQATYTADVLGDIAEKKAQATHRFNQEKNKLDVDYAPLFEEARGKWFGRDKAATEQVQAQYDAELARLKEGLNAEIALYDESERRRMSIVDPTSGRIVLPPPGGFGQAQGPPDTQPVQPGPPQTQPPQLPVEQQSAQPDQPARTKTIEQIRAAAEQAGISEAEGIRRAEAAGYTVTGRRAGGGVSGAY